MDAQAASYFADIVAQASATFEQVEYSTEKSVPNMPGSWYHIFICGIRLIDQLASDLRPETAVIMHFC